MHTNVTDEMLSYIDVLVDGEFKEALKDVTLVFRGSQNQRIINVQESKKQGKVNNTFRECSSGRNFLKS